MPDLLGKWPALSEVVAFLDSILQKKHGQFFGPEAHHPYLPPKRNKVIHDSLWGTNNFSWRELVLIDSPLFQRLRDIHQVGLAFQVYPSARHSRFEHCLGVLTIASRVFDALLRRNGGDITNIIQVVYPGQDVTSCISRLKQELRLAALLHDAGHCLFSHTSERVYQELDLLAKASRELTQMVGKKKGAGEVLSFCLASTQVVGQLLERAGRNLIGETLAEDHIGEIDMGNVALFIVGRSKHPFLQFLGDIVSSGFDADKLDYLLRDATAAGLPLRYDLDRYLYLVRLEKSVIADEEGQLQQLYESVDVSGLKRLPKSARDPFSHYEVYRLKLPQQAMSTIEQIIICKLMLFSYIYHHPKVRAAEGMLQLVLERLVGTVSGALEGKRRE